MACRETTKAVREKAKRMMAMVKKGQLTPLRSIPPSSEKTSHRRQMRNKAKYAPVMTACTVIAVMYAPTDDGISSTVKTFQFDTGICTATCRTVRLNPGSKITTFAIDLVPS